MKERVRTGIFLVLLGFVGAEARAEVCLSAQFVTRLGGAACWALTETTGGRDPVCVSRVAWNQLLRAEDPSFCFEGTTRWRASARKFGEGPGPAVLEVAEVTAFRRSAGGRWLRPWSRFVFAVERWREQVADAIRSTDTFGVLRKLLVGENLPGSPAGFLRLLGFVHLYAASGIHLYALAAYVAFFFRACVLRTGLSVEAGLRISWWASGGLWFFGWALQGFRPGLLRPLLVLLFRRVALWLGFRWRPWAPLVLAVGLDLGLAVIRLIAGAPAWAPGRMHYALAVGGGLMAWELSRRRGGFTQHFAMAVGSWLATAPLDLLETRWISAFTPVGSLLTVPLLASVAYPSALLSVAFGVLSGGAGASPLLPMVGRGVSWVVGLLGQVSVTAAFLWTVKIWVLPVAALAAVFAVCVGVRWRVALLVAVLSLRSWLGSGMAAASGDLAPVAAEVTQLDVGQGDAAAVRSAEPGLIDTGTERAIRPERWLFILRDLGARRLSWVLLTHLDEDHVGGMRSLVKLVHIDCVEAPRTEWLSPRGVRLATLLGDRGVRLVAAGDGCVPFSVVDLTRGGGRAANSAMAAVAVPVGRDLLYAGAGDASAQAEDAALRWLRALPESQGRKLVWKISHHGSRFSSQQEFLSRLGAAKVWISSGAGNRYGHPSVAVLDRLRLEGVHYQRTDEEGELRVP